MRRLWRTSDPLRRVPVATRWTGLSFGSGRPCTRLFSLRVCMALLEEGYYLDHALGGAVERARTTACVTPDRSDQIPTYLMPTTIESGPTRCSTLVSRNPASRIQPMQSAPV